MFGSYIRDDRVVYILTCVSTLGEEKKRGGGGGGAAEGGGGGGGADV